MNEFSPTYYDVHWYGPFPYDELSILREEKNLVLYMVAGTHGIYGKNVPLYIGMTEGGIESRIAQHLHWLSVEPDPPKIYAAAISEITCWKQIENKESYTPPDRSIIEDIESLLIYSHQLVYNIKSKIGLNRYERDFIVFNTGKRSSLYPEVSTMNWYGDRPEVNFDRGCQKKDQT